MNILVTGGAGYIGSHAVCGLLDKGYEVVVADNLATGYREAVHPSARFYEGDLRDRRFLSKLFEQEKIDAVIHFAASSLVGESMQDPFKYYENNLTGTQYLLEAMREAGVDRIVFSSTAAVYGEPVNVPITEDHPTVPLNPYGETKLAMEKLMRWAKEIHGIRYTALRYFNVGGAHSDGQIGESHQPETHLIPLILQVPLGKREKLMIFGNDYETKDGTCVRDYIHIEDLVDAHIRALENMNNGHEGGAFNLGSGEGFTVMEMVDAARTITGHEIMVEVGPRRAGDPAVLVASNQKARDVLGWEPKHTDIAEIIESAWKFHTLHPNGFSR